MEIGRKNEKALVQKKKKAYRQRHSVHYDPATIPHPYAVESNCTVVVKLFECKGSNSVNTNFSHHHHHHHIVSFELNTHADSDIGAAFLVVVAVVGGNVGRTRRDKKKMCIRFAKSFSRKSIGKFGSTVAD